MAQRIAPGIEVRCAKCNISRLFDAQYISSGRATGDKMEHLQRLGAPQGWKLETLNNVYAFTCPKCQAAPYDAGSFCPKCRSADVATNYCDGAVRQENGNGSPQGANAIYGCGRGIGGEHLHRACGRCKYEWIQRCLVPEEDKPNV